MEIERITWTVLVSFFVCGAMGMFVALERAVRFRCAPLGNMLLALLFCAAAQLLPLRLFGAYAGVAIAAFLPILLVGFLETVAIKVWLYRFDLIELDED
jgi:hypothetical protein